MGFIGNTPTNQFVSLKRQDLTGDGGNTYTLDYSVSSVNDVAIFISNVRQDPANYSISGTTLTTADNVEADQNFYVIFLGQGLSTQNIPEDTINGKTALTTLANDDELLVYDTSATSLKKVTRGNLISDGSIPTSKLGAGAVLQVVSATDSTQRTTTSTSYVTASNTLSVNITPSSTSSKIFVVVSSNLGLPSGANGIATIFRDSTNLEQNATYGMARASASIGVPMVMSILDSPATTSEITYQVYIKETAAVANLSLNWSNTTGSITAIEIAG